MRWNNIKVTSKHKKIDDELLYPKDLNVQFEGKEVGKIIDTKFDEHGNIYYTIEIYDQEVINKIIGEQQLLTLDFKEEKREVK